MTAPTHLRAALEQCSCDLWFDVQKENIEYVVRHLQPSREEEEGGENGKGREELEERRVVGDEAESPVICSPCHSLRWRGDTDFVWHSTPFFMKLKVSRDKHENLRRRY